ncbi:hypothetical protein [Streptomyces sp. SID13588]|uniref:hypothetical protein n=1 Tax=Streptomyces sp. SID13588 TaxID=2706051 RepID=UPI0013C87D93|nr:hypothetical protein [Streptomyces sp. SID13588]NEA72786.1 hypothetical protein [Streptomyces sp. SID13588]
MTAYDYDDFDYDYAYSGTTEDDDWTADTDECDRCTMAPGEVGPFGICCACSIGQGATPDECMCGPEDTEGAGHDDHS